jgi:hypothetical protein
MQVDCLDIHGWLGQIPQAYVTLIFDCRQNFVASFGKQRDPEIVDIMEDPWNVLTSLKSSTTSVWTLRLQVKNTSGLLTDGVTAWLLFF